MIATDTELDTRLVEAAREMAPRIAARGDEIEQGRRLPDDLVRDLIDARFFRMWQPRAYGGDEVGPLTVLAVTEELSRADGSVGWCLRTAVVAGFLNCRLDPEGAADIYGPDPSVVIAGCLHPPGEAVAIEGGYQISGRWPFASGCTHSAWMSGVCRVIENGEPRLAASGQPELRTMFFPAGEVAIIDTWYTTGLRGTGSHDIEVRDALVPERRTYTPAMPVRCAAEPGPLYRAFPLLFPIEGAFALGVAQHALDAFVELAGTKTPFTATQVLCEQPAVQETAAQAHALIASARRYLVDAEADLWAAVTGGDRGTPQQRSDARLATAFAMRNAVQAVDLIHAAAGSTGVYARSPIERCFRDLHTARADVAVGAGVVRAAGRVVLGLEANSPNF